MSVLTAEERAVRQTVRTATIANLVSKFAVVIATMVLFVVAIPFTPGLLDWNNLEAVLRNASVVGVAAVGMSFITISGNFISLGVQQSTMLAAVIVATGIRDDRAPAFALVIALLAVLAVSLVQGLIVAVGLNPVVATLAFGTMIFGAVSMYLKGSIVTFNTDRVSLLWGDILGLPAPVLAFLAVTILASVAARRLVAGRELLLVGANSDTARLSGISARRATLLAFGLLGVAVVLAGSLITSNIGRADANMAATLTIDVVTAVLVGGIAVQGGKGAPWMAALGAVFISLLNNVLVLHGATFGVRSAVSGALVVLAVVGTTALQRRSI